MSIFKKSHFLFIFLFLVSSLAAEDLTGFWQTIDKNTKKPSSVIAIYAYQGKYFGRIVAVCNSQGVVQETVARPQSKAPGIAGNRFYCGLDIIWACAPDSSGVYKGYVFDPKEGQKYTAKIWKENGNLILRGEVLMFGRNEVLTQFPQEKFNEHFVKPDLATFTPVVCKVKG